MLCHAAANFKLIYGLLFYYVGDQGGAAFSYFFFRKNRGTEGTDNYQGVSKTYSGKMSSFSSSERNLVHLAHLMKTAITWPFIHLGPPDFAW